MIFGIEDWLFWFLLAVVLLTVEMAIAFTFYAGAVVPGSLAASVVAALDGSLELQLIAFSVLSAASLLFLRPIVKRHLHPPDEAHRSNVQLMIGRRTIVLETVTVDEGLARIGEDIWSARSTDERVVLEPGDRAEVVEVRGVYAYIRPAPLGADDPAPEDSETETTDKETD